MIAFILLLFVNIWLLSQTREPQKMIEIKERYKILRDHLTETENEKFHMLTRCTPLTGFTKMVDEVGYNTNKGSEIAICLDGEVNDIFHVLIHELAHSTLDEYSHSPEFWKNYKELREICIELGIYKKINEKKEFCGKHIQDK